MVSRAAAEDAVRKMVSGPERGDLLFFIGEQTDDQLSKWNILDTDGDSAIFAFVKRKAQGAPAAPQDRANGDTSGDGGHLAWVAVPFMVLALAVNRGVSIVDEIKQCTKLITAHNDVALATAYDGVRGVGFVASVGLGVVAAVRACVKRLKVQPGRPRVSRLKRPEQQLDVAPASAGGVLPAAGTSTTGQVNASQDG